MAKSYESQINEQELVKMAALGRDFQLGTLYDYRTDAIIPEGKVSPLGSKDTYQDGDYEISMCSSFRDANDNHEGFSSVLRSEAECLPWWIYPQSASQDKALDGDNHSETNTSSILLSNPVPQIQLKINCLPLNDEENSKWKHLKLNQHLQASIAANLISKFNGSAKFCRDETDLSQAVRVVRIRIKVRTLSIDDEKLPQPSTVSGNQATHLTAKICYGVQAFCVFSHYLKPGESKSDIEEDMDDPLQQLIHSVIDDREINLPDTNEMKALFYSDLLPHPRECSIIEAFQLINKLKKSIEVNPRKAIPMTVWLKSLDNSPVVGELDEDALIGCQKLFQGMNRIKSTALTFLRQDHQLKSFAHLRESFRQLIKCVESYVTLLQDELRRLIPEIRSGEKSHQPILKLLNNVNESLFHPDKMSRWLDDKRHEMRGLKIIAGLKDQQRTVPLIQAQSILDDVLFDVRFEFTMVLILPKLDGRLDPILDSMKKYVENNRRIVRVAPRPSMSSRPEGGEDEDEGENQPWYKRDEIIQEIVRLARRMFQQVEINSEEKQSAPSVNFAMTTVLQLEDGLNVVGAAIDRRSAHRPYRPTFALYRSGLMVDGDFQLPPPPTRVRIVMEKTVSILEWDCHEMTKDIQCYLVQYQLNVNGEDTSPKWISRKTSSGTKKRMELAFLKDPSGYRFRVAAVTLAGRSPFSSVTESVAEESKPAQVQEQIKAPQQPANNLSPGAELQRSDARPTLSILSSCIRMDPHPSGLEMYALPLTRHRTRQSDGIHRFDFGKPKPAGQGPVQSKTILVMGATGSGKSTLINAMVNYILGVEWEDPFRFQLITDERPGTSQARSQTSAVSAYCLHHMEGFRIPYNLTVVDTPGYGDTEGLERDQQITANLSDFFKNAAGIQEVDAVGFVCQASLPRLTPTQIYIFDSVLSVFGNDIRDNVQFLLTFADGQKPPVLSAIEEAKVPCPIGVDGHPEHHKFNNSGFFASPLPNSSDGIDFNHLFWEMGMANFSRFFARLNTMTTKSLSLTRQVLDERKRLEVSLEGLQPMIIQGLSKMEELEIIRTLIATNESQIDASVNVQLEVEVNVAKKLDISHTGHYLTNCQTCHVTCHYPCAIKNDCDKKGCWAMDGSEIGLCRICPNKCIWSVHFNQSYRWEYVVERQLRSSEELRKKYESLVQRKLTAVELCVAMERELVDIRSEVLELVETSARCIQRLEEIALRPNPCSTPEYIDMMIKSEEHEKKTGYQQRINSLRNVRKLAELRQKIVNREAVFPLSINEQTNPAPMDDFLNLFN